MAARWTFGGTGADRGNCIRERLRIFRISWLSPYSNGVPINPERAEKISQVWQLTCRPTSVERFCRWPLYGEGPVLLLRNKPADDMRHGGLCEEEFLADQ